MRIPRGIPALFHIVWAALVVTACASSGPGGSSFEVAFDPATPRSARDGSVRVEVYLVDSCADVTLGTRPVPAVASTYVLRDGEQGTFGDALESGDYGLYGVAQDADCAVVAAGCAAVTVEDAENTFAVTLGAFEGGGCAVDQVCSMQTGDCVDGAGGTGGSGGTGGEPARVDGGLILLYAFDEGSGSTVADQSGVLPTHDLAIANPGNVTWSANHLAVDAATSLSTAGAATKVATRVQTSGELTVEAWIKPANITQSGPARIVTMSVDPYLRNFMLGQSEDTYVGRLRADGETDWANGLPEVLTTPRTATTALTHVVFTHRSDGAEVLYVNGVQNTTFMRMGAATAWDAAYPLIVANEETNDRAWLGELHLIAVYDQALDIGEVEQNFMAGP